MTIHVYIFLYLFTKCNGLKKISVDELWKCLRESVHFKPLTGARFLLQPTELVEWNEQFPGIFGHNLQERPQQLQTSY